MNRIRTLLAIAVLALLGSATFAQDWTRFRGPEGNASSDSAAPVEWNVEGDNASNLVWKTKLDGRGASSPIVVGGKIFITSFSGYGIKPNKRDWGNKDDLKLHLSCFDKQSGKELWNQEMDSSPNTQDCSKRIIDHGYASATPVSDGKMIFASFGVSGLFAFDLDGNKKWHATIGKKTTGFGSSSSPVVHGDLVFINGSIESGTLYAFNKSTGELAWKRGEVTRSWSSPCIAKVVDPAEGEPKFELVLNQKEVIYGLNPENGEELWNCQGIPDYVVPVPVAHDGIVYCLGGRSNRAMAITLGGRGDVTDSHKLWDVPIGANVTSPLYYDGHLYWASDRGVANCMDAETGETIFQERMPTKARVYASIVRADKHLYLTTRDKGIQVLAAKPEFEQLALNKLESGDDLFNASPAVSGNHLIVRSDSWLFCIGDKK